MSTIFKHVGPNKFWFFQYGGNFVLCPCVPTPLQKVGPCPQIWGHLVQGLLVWTLHCNYPMLILYIDPVYIYTSICVGKREKFSEKRKLLQIYDIHFIYIEILYISYKHENMFSVSQHSCIDTFKLLWKCKKIQKNTKVG